MSKRPATFTQTDVSRVLKAVRVAGVKARVDIMPDGRISILPVDYSEVSPESANPWEEAIAEIGGGR
jgi:hypothetical protein